MAKIRVDFETNNLRKSLKTLEPRINRKISQLMDYNAAYSVGWLKQNAPWTDRTSAARTGLTATAFTIGNTHEILMAYSVYYGIWLEVANSGKYAVITPGLRTIGEKIMDDMKNLINSIVNG